MKRYLKELVIVICQLFLFYVFPLFAGPTDAMGMVFLILLGTFALSLVLGILSRSGVKWGYPAACALLFVPTVPIYYNFSAMIHATWYLVIAAVGLALGSGLGALVRKVRKNN